MNQYDTILLLRECRGFQWDSGNRDKNWKKHQVNPSECEQCFFNEPLFLLRDEKHSQSEQRYVLLSKTDLGRRLVIVFTVRDKKIRVISARNMSRKERSVYEQANTRV